MSPVARLLRRPRVDLVPTTPDELTPGWLTHAMRQSGAINSSAMLTHLDIRPIGTGVAMSGVTRRIGLTWDTDDPALPSSAIAKFAATDPRVRGLVESLDIYGREIAFYQELASTMPIRVPRHFASHADPQPAAWAAAAGQRVVDAMPQNAQLALTIEVEKVMRPTKRRYVLVIEDLGEDFDVFDLVEPPTPDQLGAALSELAELHAMFWGRRELADARCVSALVTTTPRLYRNVYQGRCRGLLTDLLGTRSDAAELLSRADTAAESLADDVAVINRPITLVHGDPRSDNILYQANGPVFVDWALVGFANPAFDVAYLLGSSVREEQMATVAPDLTRRYLAALSAQGRTVGIDLFWPDVMAAARAILMQQLMGLQYDEFADYGDQGRAGDHWVPRLLALMSLDS